MSDEQPTMSPDERARHLAVLSAAKAGDVGAVSRYLREGGIDINFAEPQTGLTALHIAAARSATAVVRQIVATGKADLSLKDRKGRTAATLAATVARNLALARYLFDLQHGCGIAVDERRRRAPDDDAKTDLP